MNVLWNPQNSTERAQRRALQSLLPIKLFLPQPKNNRLCHRLLSGRHPWLVAALPLLGTLVTPKSVLAQPSTPPQSYVANSDAERLEQPTRSSVHTVIRGGMNLLGTGVMDFDGKCTTGCPNIIDDRVKTKDLRRWLVGVDVLARHGLVGFGAGFWIVPEVAVQLSEKVSHSGERKHALGTTLNLPLLLEVGIPVTPEMDIMVRGAAGLEIFFAGGTVERDRKAMESACRKLGSDADCGVTAGAVPGWLIGTGPGLVYHLTPLLALRLDLLVERHNLPLLEGYSREPRADWSQEYKYSGYRTWMLLGLEVGP